ncbi:MULTISPECIES: hypothetical protein [Actinoplanes]|uniref:TolB family protein n=1 Tax=Actinoplanes TaxID=1865 RepID=UPI001FE16A7D|nr:MULTISPECIES: hypothetical protein [Actinoplanes]
MAETVTLAAAVGFSGSVVQAGSVEAATPALPSMVAYVRGGDIFASMGEKEQRLTTGGNQARPRWSPNGKQLAYLKDGQLWTMNADGSGQRRLTTRAAAGPSWSPDGKWIAFASLSCTGAPGVFRISTAQERAAPEVVFPQDCRGEPLPSEAAAKVSGKVSGNSLNDRLRADDAVAWSPDGKQVAFRGGECESTYDACLSIGDVKTGSEKTVAAYGGGGLQNSGFAVVPSWRADGAKLSWTAYEEGETDADSKPVHLVEYDTMNGAKRTVGSELDRELAYVDGFRAVVTSQNANDSWVTLVNLTNGSRTPFRVGSQPSVQPVG